MAARLSSGRGSRGAAAMVADARLFLNGSPDKDDANRTVLAALFIRVPLEKESTILAPVITLHVRNQHAARCLSDAHRTGLASSTRSARGIRTGRGYRCDAACG